MPSTAKTTIQSVLQTAAQLLDLNEQVEVSVLLVDNETIRNFNRDYRGKDSITDVLSFPLEESADDEEPVILGGPDERLLGDIVISVEQAISQAHEYGHSLERELAFLAVHGLLHLLGHDHEKGCEAEQAMRSEEERILSRLDLTR